MLRKFVVILTMLLCSMATQVYALGLGSVSVESTLNQPLRVRIELLQLADTRLQDVSVRIASPDDFQRFNIERVGFLSNVSISLEATATGNAVILSSNQVVREPYLSFILETRWPSGRLLSEHTVLLDLPVFDDQSATAAVRQPINPVLRPPETDQRVTPSVGNAPAVSPATSAGQINSAADLQPEILEVAPEPEVPSVTADATEEAPTASVEVVAEAEQVSSVVETAAEQEPQVPEEPEPAVALEEESQTDVVAAEEVAVQEEPQVEDIAEEETPDASIAAIQAEPEEQPPESIETTSADTLSDIAMRVRQDSSVSMQQTMLAIQQLNPDAFIDGNINRMRSGQVLRVPSLADIQAVDPREAMDEVTSQNQQFTSADIQPLAAPANTSPVQDDVQPGRLSVVNSDVEPIDASSAASSGLDDEENAELDRRIVELENQLAARQEEADRARIEREELNSRLQDLESQIAGTQEIIRLQDIRLAQLQDSLAAAAEIAEQEAALAAAQAAATPQPIESSSNRTLVDDLFRILGANSMFMVFGVALIILLLVVLLLRRNKASKHDDEEIDEIAEQAFDDSDAGGLNEEEPLKDSEYEDFDATDLDSELSEIVGLDVDDFDEESAGDEEAKVPESKIDSLLDDMGIKSIDDLDDEVSGFAVTEDETEIAGNEQAEIEEIEISEPGESEVEFDSGDEEGFAAAEESSEAAADESASAPEELEHFDFVGDELASDSTESTANNEEDLEIHTLEFEAEALSKMKEEPQSDAKEELDLETFSFVADEQVSGDTEPEASDDEEIEFVDDLDAVDFDAGGTDVSEEDSSEAVAEKEEELETFEFDLGESSSNAIDEVTDETAEPSEVKNDDSDLSEVQLAAESAEEESSDVEEELPKVELELADEDEDDLEFLSDDFELDLNPVSDVEEIELLPSYDESESATKLELAYAYQKMGDPEGAKEILREVIKEGNEEQIAEAKGLLSLLGGSAE